MYIYVCVCIYIYIYIYISPVCLFFFFFHSNADGEWRPHKEPLQTNLEPSLRRACMPFSCFHVEVTSPPCGGGLRLWCSQAALPWARPEGPSLSPRGPKLEGHVHCPLPGAWPFLSAPSPPSQPRLLAPPCPCKPSRLLKAPAGVHRAGTGGFKPHSLHTEHKCPCHWLLEENRKLFDHSCCHVARVFEKSQKSGFLCEKCFNSRPSTTISQF